MHVLAISGLHISIIGMSVYTLLKRLGVGLKGSACLSGFIVLSYGVMTGFGPSTERAVIMFLVRMGAVYLGCTYDFLSALSFSALILFVSRPLSILQTGVWFSFAAVLSIGVLWPAIEKCIPWQCAKTRNYRTFKKVHGGKDNDKRMDRKNDTLYRPIRSSDDRNTSVDGILLRRSPASRLFSESACIAADESVCTNGPWRRRCQSTFNQHGRILRRNVAFHFAD